MLSKIELIRYQRQLQLQQLGMSGQKKLKQAKVLVVGAGGLGCAALQYLVAAGAGKIGIVDFDTVAVSNLHRQVLYTMEDVGKSKVDCAIRCLSKQNEHVHLQGFDMELNNTNASEIFGGYDVIIDGTDNYATRYAVNDACVLIDKPLVYGAIYRFEGQVAVFNYHTEGLQGPTYRCLFPAPPVQNAFLNCSETGVLGVLPGMIGCMQANEAIKIITGMGEVMSGKLMLFNILSTHSQTILFDRNDDILASMPRSIEEYKKYDYKLFCSITQAGL